VKSLSASLAYLYVPEGRVFEVQILLSLPTEKIRQTTEAIRSSETLKNLREDDEPVKRIASAANLSFAQALAVWYAVSNLSRQRTAQKIADGDFLSDLHLLAPEGAPPFDEVRQKVLLDLFARTSEGTLLEKAEFLKRAYAPSLVSCRSVCDIRPLFDEKRERIESAALVVILGLETHTDDHEMKTVVVQATRSKLADLKKCITEAENKLAVMERVFGGNVQLF